MIVFLATKATLKREPTAIDIKCNQPQSMWGTHKVNKNHCMTSIPIMGFENFSTSSNSNSHERTNLDPFVKEM